LLAIRRCLCNDSLAIMKIPWADDEVLNVDETPRKTLDNAFFVSIVPWGNAVAAWHRCLCSTSDSKNGALGARYYCPELKPPVRGAKPSGPGIQARRALIG
jgi:hypothetical protein